MYCFAFGCNCSDSRKTCRFFRFPAEKTTFRKWESMCRRKDRRAKQTDRLCSCHFVDGKKENGASIFPLNAGKRFDFPQANYKRTRSRVQDKRHVPAKSTAVTAQHIPLPSSAGDQLSAETTAVTAQHNPLASSAGDHTYGYSCPSTSCQTRLRQMQEKKQQLDQQVRELVVQNNNLQEGKPFTVADICDNDEKMLMYTSFTYDVFTILVSVLERFSINYYAGWTVQAMTVPDQLLLTLMKLRLNLKDLDLATRFQISRSTVSNILYTFIHVIHELLFDGIMAQGIPSQLKCQGSMPISFSQFSSTRAIIDATEVTQDIPSDLNKQADCYSNYKSRHTLKGATAVAPNGALVYCSSLYPGSVSDVAIVEHSHFLDHFVPGDLILADKGFTIYDKLPTGVSLNIPPFLTGKSHFTKQEAELCMKIGRARIHVERANERMKNYEILNHIPAHYRSLSTKIFQVCACLVNLQAPLLKEIADKYEM